MDVRLDPTGTEVRLGDVALSTPGLDGVVSVAGAAPGRRVRGLTAPPAAETALDRVLAEEGVVTQREIRIDGTREQARRARGAPILTPHEQPGIAVTVPPPPAGMEQFVIYKDESDVVSWHFAETTAAARAIRARGATRAPAQRTYVLPRRVPTATSPRHARSIWGAIGQKVIKVVVFPLAGVLVGKAAQALAGKWERKRRATAVRSFGPADFRQPTSHPPDWRTISGGRALLVVHGTLTQAHIEFTRVPADFVAWLDQSYGGRTFAFDHFTLSESPTQNVEWFLKQVPAGTTLDLDVLCISRGGLVSRELARLGGGRLRIGKIVYVASPNAGTALASPERIGDFISSWTNMVNLLPDNPVTYVLEALVTIAKIASVGILQGLVGLQCMNPDGDFLKSLNASTGAGSPPRYFAVASDFEPVHSGFRDWTRDVLVDRVFHASNDLMVPTTGVFDRNGAAGFPIPAGARLVFGRDAGISHSGYLPDERVRTRISKWLAASATG